MIEILNRIIFQQKFERVNVDGSKEIHHPNGTTELQKSDGSVVYTYKNGDTRSINSDYVEVC